MSAPINVEKCVAYLRYARIEISDDVAGQWREQEIAERARRRAHNRELKKSCGHFSTHETKVYWENGGSVHEVCNACGRTVSERPMGSPPPRRRKGKVA